MNLKLISSEEVVEELITIFDHIFKNDYKNALNNVNDIKNIINIKKNELFRKIRADNKRMDKNVYHYLNDHLIIATKIYLQRFILTNKWFLYSN